MAEKKNTRQTPERTMADGNPAAQPADDPRVPQPTPAPEVDPDVDPDAKTPAPEASGDYYSDTVGSEQG